MITFFTTTKKFQGHAKDSQLNAIRSWLSIHPEIEILIFERPEGVEYLPVSPNIKIIDYVELEAGIPRIDYMFDYASNNAQNRLCCFINADIIVTGDFITAVKQLINLQSGGFLAVGQRYDFDNTNGEWDFSAGWEKKYLSGPMKIHAPAGSDYFLFPKGQYEKSSMVPLIVGRPSWDLWMIYNARKRALPVIDLSVVYKVFHQNHDYSHKKVAYKKNTDEPEAKHNMSFLPPNGQFDFTLYGCDLFLDKDFKLKRTFARGKRKRFIKIESVLGKNTLAAQFTFLINIGWKRRTSFENG
jgi:hypothetical protein